jgi:hypothetical protein
VAIAIAIAFASPAHAQTVDASSTTLLAGRADPRDGKIYTSVPLYQIVSLQLSDVKMKVVDDLHAVVTGWGRLELGGIASFDGDLDLAFVEGKLFSRRLLLRAGRQLVSGGAARLVPLDGGSFALRIWRGLSLSAFGGVPVTPRFALPRGEAMAGGRLAFRVSFNTEVGVSFLHVHDQGRSARQEFALDGRYQPHRTVWLTGYASFSTLEARLVEADLAANWQPLHWIQAHVDYRRTAPDLWIPRSSIFSVFTMMSRDEAGASIFLRPVPRLRLEADYHLIHDEAGIGHRGGGRVRVSLGTAFQSWVGGEASFIKLSEQGYVRVRLTAAHHFLPTLLGTLDGDVYRLDRDVNGERLSLTGAATLGWEFSPRWSAVVAIVADSTPLVEQRVEGTIKLVYNRTIRIREVQK